MGQLMRPQVGSTSWEASADALGTGVVAAPCSSIHNVGTAEAEKRHAC